MSEQPLVPRRLSAVNLSDFDPAYTAGYDKETAKLGREALEDRLDALQEMLYAQSRHSLLIVLQGMDAGGKDGTIKKVFDAVNPQGITVTSFKAPTPEDLAHDFLWRIHQHTPEKGKIGIFNRSHYEDVLIVRVNDLVPKAVWSRRYDHINRFEKMLADSGTTILKFFLYISKDEQKARLQARLDDPAKHWKFSTADLVVREQWDDYMNAYEDALSKTNTRYAPWHIVPANHKWYRNLVVLRAVVNALEALDLAYPQPEANLEGVEIPD